MANTDITLINDGGIYVPSAASVPVVSGDTVSFSTKDENPAWLFFSPDAASILSPKRANPVPVPASGKMSFTFSSSQPGAYSVICMSNARSAPRSFPGGSSNVLRLEVDASAEPTPFSPTMTTGH